MTRSLRDWQKSEPRWLQICSLKTITYGPTVIRLLSLAESPHEGG